MKATSFFKRTLAAVFLGMFFFPGLVRAGNAEVISLQPGPALDGTHKLKLLQDGNENVFYVDRQTLIVRRVPVEKIAPGDQIWRNRVVKGFKGVKASVPLSSGASKWFGIPRVERVAGVPGVPDVPEKTRDEQGRKQYESFADRGETVAAVEKTARGLVLTFKETGKKKLYAPGRRVYKVFPVSELKPRSRVLARSADGSRLARVLIEE